MCFSYISEELGFINWFPRKDNTQKTQQFGIAQQLGFPPVLTIRKRIICHFNHFYDHHDFSIDYYV